MARRLGSTLTVLFSLLCSAAAGTELVTDRDGHWVALWVRDGLYITSVSSDDGKTWTKPKQSGTVSGNLIGMPAEAQIPVRDLLSAVVPEKWTRPFRNPDACGGAATGNEETPFDICGKEERYFIKLKGQAEGTDRVREIGRAWSQPCAASDTKGNWLVTWAEHELRACCSNDHGKTWSGDILLPMPENKKLNLWPYEAKGIITAAGTWCVIWDTGEFGRGSGDGPSTGPSSIWATTSRDKGKTWTDPVELTKGIENNNDSISNLSTVFANGRVYVAWSQKVPDKKGIPPNSDIVLVSSADGLNWTHPEIINGNSQSHAQNNRNPRLCTDGKKLLLCMWDATRASERWNTRADRVFIARSEDAGNTWSFPATLDFEPEAGTHPHVQEGVNARPCVATDKKGRWVAVWDSSGMCPEQYGLDEDIMTSYSDDLGKTWSKPAPVNTNAAKDYANDRNPQIAYSEDGHWVTAWDYAPTELQGYSRSCRAAYSADGRTWSAPAELPPLDDNDKVIAYMRLAALGNGNWLVVYERSSFIDGPFTAVSTRSDDNGKSWKDTTKLSGAYGGIRPEDEAAFGPIATRLSDGTCLVLWWEYIHLPGNSAESSIFSRTSRDGGATWSGPAKLPVEAASKISGRICLITSSAGNLLAMWAEPQERELQRKQWASLSTDNGKTWSPSQVISTASAWALGTDGKGRYLSLLENYVYKESRDQSYTEIKLSRSDDGKTWAEPKVLSVLHGTPYDYVDTPSLATDGNGHWMAVCHPSGWLGNSNTAPASEDASPCLLLTSEDNGLTWSAPASSPFAHKPQANR